MTVLANGLETDDYGQQQWQALYNRNMELLNGELLKVQSLSDVSIEKLPDNCFLVWDASKARWRPASY
jgi:hypothetical protein